MTETTVGQASKITEADKNSAKPRLEVQEMFAKNQGTPALVFAGMIAANVSVNELTDCLQPTINALHWLREHGAPEGIPGLLVWKPYQVDQYLAWKPAQYNPIGGGTFAEANEKAGLDPFKDMTARLIAQDVLDTAYRRKALDVGYLAPWEA